MNKNDVLYHQYFGFSQKHSTQQAIIMLVDKITKSLDAEDIVISVFLDLKKTFDTVDHHILLKKYMRMAFVEKCWNGFIVICLIDPNMSFMTICNLKRIISRIYYASSIVYHIYIYIYIYQIYVIYQSFYRQSGTLTIFQFPIISQSKSEN